MKKMGDNYSGDKKIVLGGGPRMFPPTLHLLSSACEGLYFSWIKYDFNDLFTFNVQKVLQTRRRVANGAV